MPSLLIHLAFFIIPAHAQLSPPDNCGQNTDCLPRVLWCDEESGRGVCQLAFCDTEHGICQTQSCGCGNEGSQGGGPPSPPGEIAGEGPSPPPGGSGDGGGPSPSPPPPAGGTGGSDSDPCLPNSDCVCPPEAPRGATCRLPPGGSCSNATDCDDNDPCVTEGCIQYQNICWVLNNLSDVDKDGQRDCEDACPNDPDKTEPGIAGCGKKEKEPPKEKPTPYTLPPWEGGTWYLFAPPESDQLPAFSSSVGNVCSSCTQTLWTECQDLRQRCFVHRVSRLATCFPSGMVREGWIECAMPRDSSLDAQPVSCSWNGLSCEGSCPAPGGAVCQLSNNQCICCGPDGCPVRSSSSLSSSSSASSIPPPCGNGIVERTRAPYYYEQCDPPTGEDGSPLCPAKQRCNALCQCERLPNCGDGFLQIGEECDESTQNSPLPNSCRPDCTAPFCGDGIVDNLFGEECDAGVTCRGGKADGMECYGFSCKDPINCIPGDLCRTGGGECRFVGSDSCTPDCTLRQGKPGAKECDPGCRGVDQWFGWCTPCEKTTMSMCADCERCGEGFFNICDAKECGVLGFCEYKGGLVNLIQGNACLPDNIICT